MTLDKKILIEPSDVAALHFECANCHASIVVPLSAGVGTFAANMASGGCDLCHTNWGIQSQSAEHKTIATFTQSLEKLASIMEGRNLKLKMEIVSFGV